MAKFRKSSGEITERDLKREKEIGSHERNEKVDEALTNIKVFGIQVSGLIIAFFGLILVTAKVWFLVTHTSSPELDDFLIPAAAAVLGYLFGKKAIDK